MLVVAIDPGHGTGISTYHTVTGEFYTEEVIGFLEGCSRIVHHLSALNEIQVVCESYTVTAKTAQLTQQHEPLKLIGVTEYECAKREHSFKLQQPAMRKPGEAKLKPLGWFVKSKDGHSNSSSGHLLVFLLKNQLLHPSDMQKLKDSLS